jgi:hypothetical protein
MNHDEKIIAALREELKAADGLNAALKMQIITCKELVNIEKERVKELEKIVDTLVKRLEDKAA